MIAKPIPIAPRYKITEDGTIFGKLGRQIKVDINEQGYAQIGLGLPNGKTLKAQISRLVLMTFDRMPVGEEQAAHLDGVPLNNHISNLKWCSRKENESHKIIHGTLFKGRDTYLAKLTEDDVRYIRKHYRFRSKQYNSVELGKKLGISGNAVLNVINGKTWKHVEELK